MYRVRGSGKRHGVSSRDRYNASEVIIFKSHHFSIKLQNYHHQNFFRAAADLTIQLTAERQLAPMFTRA